MHTPFRQPFKESVNESSEEPTFGDNDRVTNGTREVPIPQNDRMQTLNAFSEKYEQMGGMTKVPYLAKQKMAST